MSKLDDIMQRAKTVFVAPGTAHARWETTVSEDKQQIIDLFLGLIDSCHNAEASGWVGNFVNEDELRQKVNEL